MNCRSWGVSSYLPEAEGRGKWLYLWKWGDRVERLAVAGVIVVIGSASLAVRRDTVVHNYKPAREKGVL